MIILFVLLFFINPCLGVTCYGVYLTLSKGINNRDFYLFYLLLALFLGFINMTKVPVSDLAYHATQYSTAQGYSWLQYLAIFGREYVFYSLNYLIFQLTGGSVKYWILILSSGSYFIFFSAVHQFHSKINKESPYLMFAIVIAAFFPQLFSLSAHLVRQFVASSILVYVITSKLFIKRNRWWLAIIGTLIHSTAIIFYTLLYSWFLKNRPNKKIFCYT